MTWATHVASQRGAVSALLVVEGCPKAFATGILDFPTLSSTAGVDYPEIVAGALDPDSVRWSYSVDLRDGKPSMRGCSFRLHDVPDGLVQHGLTALMLGHARATTSELRASVTSGGGSIEVDATTGWAASGVLYLEQEAISYTALAGAPPRFTGCTRGIYHSRARAHDYDARDPERIGDVGLVPVLYSVYPSWIGRKVQLWVASVETDGTLSAPTRVWNGRVKSAPALGADGLTWTVDCEHLWDAIDVPIMATAANTYLSGLRVSRPRIEWNWDVLGGVPSRRSGSFDLPATTYRDLEDLCSQFTSALEAELVADGIVDDHYVIEMSDSLRGRVVQWRMTEEGTGGELTLWWDDDTLTSLFGVSFIVFPPRMISFAVPSIGDVSFYLHRAETTEVLVASTDDFLALDIENADGDQIKSVVAIGEHVFWLRSVDAGTNTLTLQILASQADAEGGVVTEQLPVRQGIVLIGSMFGIWQELLTNTSIPREWIAGLDQADFDWTELESQEAGGVASRRFHCVVGPQSLRDLMLEDLRYAGLIPSISASGALVSARPLSPPVYAASTEVIDGDSDRHADLPQLTPIRSRVVTTVQVLVQSAIGPDTITIWDATVNQRTLQALYGAQPPLEIRCRGFYVESSLEAHAAHIAALAGLYFVIFSGEALVGEIPCSIRPALLLPGHVAEWSHPTVPDGATGVRGITSSLLLVTGIEVRPFDGQCSVEVYLPVEQHRRGGWAPSARITDYVDDGAGAGAARYRLVVSAGLYSDRAEGLDFGAGDKVRLAQRDDETPLSESLTVSSAAHSADGLAIYVTAPPVNDPGTAGGTWVLTLDAYDTASQTATAKRFVHVADDADGLIGTSGERGFRPA